MQAVLFPAPSWQVRLGGKAITKQGSSIYTAWGVLSCTKSHPPPPRQQHKYSLLPPLKLTSFFIMHLFLFFSSIFPSALLGSPIHKGGWRGERETERNGRKRASGEGGIGAVMESNHINSEIFTSGLENAMVQLWQTNRPPPFPQHTHRHTHKKKNPKNKDVGWGWGGRGGNHITWNCHSFFDHSSFLLMFGFCHKLSLITRYSELRSLSPQRRCHMQPAGPNKTAHIYYIWHTPRSFCFISE